MVASPKQLGAEIVAMCRSVGFALAGVCDVAPTSYEKELRTWLAAGRHGSMQWMEHHLDVRLDPMRLLEGARSIVMVADLYASRVSIDEKVDESAQGARGRIARYARGDDYHKTIKQRLHTITDALRERFPESRFRSFTDTAPVLEREHTARAGLGWIGKHTLLIHPSLGSYLLLGGFVTTLDLEAPAEQSPVADHCGSCTRCIDACPTGAITPYSVDASRCVSAMTIEHRELIEPSLHQGMRSWIFGCDICQEVCPHNSARSPAARNDDPDVNEKYAPRHGSFDLLDVLGWDESLRRRAFTKSAMKRAKLDMMKRNALIVAGNLLEEHDNAALAERIAEMARDEGESEIVRETAIATLRRLSADGPRSGDDAPESARRDGEPDGLR